ncbi:MAG: DUF6080 domain-containing protein [Bacteroidales bacterium]|nr:DUF6080 domain-containing protein [Bacteroidales bacterium]
MIKKTNIRWQQIKTLLRSVLQDLTPSNRTEWLLFSFFFITYSICGIFISLSSDLLDNTDGVGSYLGYDNLYHLKTKGGNLDISHPYLLLFYLAKHLITSILIPIFGTKAKIIFCTLLTDWLISTALLILYKYLRRTTALPVYRSMLLTLFCSLFFTIIILSFTIESYPFSFLFLSLSLLVLSVEYEKQKRFSFSGILLFEFLCGGITITNAFKPLSALLIDKGTMKEKIKRVTTALIPFILCVIIVFLLYSLKSGISAKDGEQSPLQSILNVPGYFAFDGHFAKEILVDFWGTSILSAPLTQQTIGNETVLRPSAYTHAIPYIAIGSLLLLFILSFILNRKEILVRLIFCYLLVDIVIHFIARYGLNEAVIFGGHWLFTVPLILGWLYNRFSEKNQHKLMYTLDIYLITFIILLLFNNGKILLHSFLLPA